MHSFIRMLFPQDEERQNQPRALKTCASIDNLCYKEIKELKRTIEN